ncbi:hypothetical protein SARC_05609 [Sphaeroforma arctica JP610]|uniref:Diphthamide biosynthesis protein 4 n=1 Tax=Sphaeroforma arctica JP610 TaxID=667725 RepID=A0A0L0FZS4_9EUKA|nr:hypothetical protein SARC_05609 [Sphaeroforma arctica JP610]KNC82099.1 hypothetical protein SARC_05609 [Sphaeroforma arctica JP610]|eukprot:XP_014156001.1 hypothetical protein SARC_05609 [Sphaeroforma arctica JP610]
MTLPNDTTLNTNRTYYDILDVTRCASPATIRASYHRLILKYHPDKVQSLSQNSNVSPSLQRCSQGEVNAGSGPCSRLEANASMSDTLESSGVSVDEKVLCDKRRSVPNTRNIFACIQEAYATLRDATQRSIYDARIDNSDWTQSCPGNGEVDLDDMDYNESDDTYSQACRCGGDYIVSGDELEQGLDVVQCSQCSLSVHVLFAQQ